MTQRSLTDAHIVDSFTADAEFALQVDQGETFTVETRDRFEPLFRGEPLDRASVVALVGPVAIEGVRAGDVVEIEIVDIKSRTGFGYLLRNQTFGLFKTDIEERVEAIPVSSQTITLPGDIPVPSAPMIGKLGLLRSEPDDDKPVTQAGGAFSSIVLGPGTKLYVKAERDGAGVCLEDVHARMGDGEATASAIEMAAVVTLRCQVLSSPPPVVPFALTDTSAVTFGQGADADEASLKATQTMSQLLCSALDTDLTAAAGIIGAAVDIRLSFVGGRPAQARAEAPRALFPTLVGPGAR